MASYLIFGVLISPLIFSFLNTRRFHRLHLSVRYWHVIIGGSLSSVMPRVLGYGYKYGYFGVRGFFFTMNILSKASWEWTFGYSPLHLRLLAWLSTGIISSLWDEKRRGAYTMTTILYHQDLVLFLVWIVTIIVMFESVAILKTSRYFCTRWRRRTLRLE